MAEQQVYQEEQQAVEQTEVPQDVEQQAGEQEYVEQPSALFSGQLAPLPTTFGLAMPQIGFGGVPQYQFQTATAFQFQGLGAAPAAPESTTEEGAAASSTLQPMPQTGSFVGVNLEANNFNFVFYPEFESKYEDAKEDLTVAGPVKTRDAGLVKKQPRGKNCLFNCFN